ncbi:hypothetical protein FOG48_02443 [Hanseniaspora uvarum]|nr:hypothetical protein FOG48_02443 [Hanseniaspora uvarum]
MSYRSIDTKHNSSKTLGFDELIMKDDLSEIPEEFFTDEATYINIIFNILNLIYATNPNFIDKTHLSFIPIHLIFDRIYYQYSNLLSNPNIDRFVIKNYKKVEEALDFYLVNYCSFEQLKTHEINLTFYKQSGIPMNIYTPNLMSKCIDEDKEDNGLYIIQHHIGGIRNSQCYITNDLSFKADSILKEVNQNNIKRKRFLYLDYANEIYWMLNIDDMLNDNAIISFLPLSLIIKENNRHSNKITKKKKTNDMFLTNKILNFFFYENFQIHNMNNVTLYKYINENQMLMPSSDDTEDEFFIDRIIKTGGFNETYKDIHKLPKQTNFEDTTVKQLTEDVIISKSPLSSSPGLISKSPASSMGSNLNSLGRSVSFKKKQLSRASTFENDFHNNNFHNNYDSIPNVYSNMSRSTSHYTYEETNLQSKKSFKKNFLLVISPVSKILIIIVLVEFKKHASKNTKIIISNSWRYLIAGSLFLSILFTFCNLLLLTYTKLEIILSLLDVLLVFVLVFDIMIWIL